MNNDLLDMYGYDDYFKYHVGKMTENGKEAFPARIIAQHKYNYLIVTHLGEYMANVSGKYRFSVEEKGGYPAVGDYVLVRFSETKDRAVIHELLPRKTMFYRKDNWNKNGLQIVATNFDTVFICLSLNKDFNISRLKRYLVMAQESKADITVILTKADLCPEVETCKARCEEICGNVPVYAVSAKDQFGLDRLSPYFEKGKTVVALGSSGVGKSSLVNAIFGDEIMEVGEIREYDDKGRHTTVHRQIVVLPSGGLYLDTPGMREIGIIDAADAISNMFSDIEDLMTKCRFKDCHHLHEPECAVRIAISNGSISDDQFQQYLRFKIESSFAEGKESYLFGKWQQSKGYSKDYKKIKNAKRVRKCTI